MNIEIRVSECQKGELAELLLGSVADDDEEQMKRLTIDIPFSLHRKVKYECAMSGETIRDVVIELLTEKYGK